MGVADDASSFRASCMPNIGFLLCVGKNNTMFMIVWSIVVCELLKENKHC